MSADLNNHLKWIQNLGTPIFETNILSRKILFRIDLKWFQGNIVTSRCSFGRLTEKSPKFDQNLIKFSKYSNLRPLYLENG